MANLIINGGKTLTGKINVNSAKNSAVAILCATAMIEGKTILCDVPMIEEVHRIIEVLTSIGLKIHWEKGKHLVITNDGDLKIKEIDKEAFLKTRSALLLMGALSSELKVFSLPKSGGCNLGKRTVNPYLIAMKEMGIKIKETLHEYQVDASKKKPASFTMYESGDTATENTIMAAALTTGTTTINFASSNYMVQDLICYLKAAGANIEWSGINRLKIIGVKKLKAVENYPIMPDPIESMAFISLAITSHSHLKIIGCPIDFLSLEIEKLKVMGQKLKIGKVYKSKNKFFDLVDIEVIPSKLKALADKIHPNPYPGLNIDNLPLFVPILTQAEGQTMVHDWVYENRAIYYAELNRLGADITLMDPHRVIVKGISTLKPNEMVCPPALRPSINLLICMLAAKGKSVLRNSYPIDRGYENIYERLNALGADIKVFE
ncbi:MAG: UDP-N-acetylglucosamine 1-carboxyvinyltransferase [Patescibacteria group bacterium]